MIWKIILLIAGFVVLIKGADILISGASSIATRFKVPKSVVGLTIIAFGTSIPELAVSINALASGQTDILLGNVIGSCIINILLLVGVAAVIKPIPVKSNTIRKELPICLLISILFAVLFLDKAISGFGDNLITRSDAVVVLLFFGVFIYYIVASIRRNRQEELKKKRRKVEIPEHPLFKSIVFVLLGITGVIVGSELVVDNAVGLAEIWGISQRIIAMTIVTFGTGLPELMTTIVASKKGEQDLLIGNIIGSNIFDLCIVLGIPVVLFGAIGSGTFQIIDLAVMLIATTILMVFALTGRRISRLEGTIMLMVFAGYYAVLLIG